MADALRSAAPQEHPGRRQGWARREDSNARKAIATPAAARWDMAAAVQDPYGSANHGSQQRPLVRQLAKVGWAGRSR